MNFDVRTASKRRILNRNLWVWKFRTNHEIHDFGSKFHQWNLHFGDFRSRLSKGLRAYTLDTKVSRLRPATPPNAKMVQIAKMVQNAKIVQIAKIVDFDGFCYF